MVHAGVAVLERLVANTERMHTAGSKATNGKISCQSARPHPRTRTRREQRTALSQNLSQHLRCRVAARL
jgi:hypothetical protein